MDRFPPEVQELVMQLKLAGADIDENNPQQILQERTLWFVAALGVGLFGEMLWGKNPCLIFVVSTHVV